MLGIFFHVCNPTSQQRIILRQPLSSLHQEANQCTCGTGRNGKPGGSIHTATYACTDCSKVKVVKHCTSMFFLFQLVAAHRPDEIGLNSMGAHSLFESTALMQGRGHVLHWASKINLHWQNLRDPLHWRFPSSSATCSNNNTSPIVLIN